MAIRNKPIRLHEKYLVICNNHTLCDDQNFYEHRYPHYTSHVNCRCESVACFIGKEEKRHLCVKYERGE